MTAMLQGDLRDLMETLAVMEREEDQECQERRETSVPWAASEIPVLPVTEE